MPEGKLLVGLSWQPQLLIPSSSKATDACHNKPQSEASNSSLWKPNTELVDGLFVPPNDPRKLNKLLRKQAKDTAGKDWFDMPAQTITPELQTDLKLLKLRSALDPKRHYKKGDSNSKALPKYFQVGTVVEDASEFYSERLTKKERKATIADELLSDKKLAAYRKRKVREIEEQNQTVGNTKWKIRGQNSWKRAKERRVANPQENGNKVVEKRELELDERINNNNSTLSSSMHMIFPGLNREEEMSAMVSALTHVV
ncbi:hypothetical protein AHAS_Ahas20G0231400 [Arachis hypogaea]